MAKNYQAHAKEMGMAVDKGAQSPSYFQKNPVNLVACRPEIDYPPGTSDCHYEMELVVAIGKTGFEVKEDDANELIFGYACGLDMTRRDLQRQAKEQGGPWDTAKDFEQSAVLSPIVSKSETGIIDSGRVELRLNQELRQSSDLSMMIWSVPEIIADLSRLYHLEPGDLIYTGTPEGVGSVTAGDLLEGSIERVGGLSLHITGP
ncbi:MAG: fumarylacetoacetate hydrolase family protein [Woeseiaceae bacterium]|nr:fumarylacetoacetate hydrolase family protein [Woeseiaceae bacterium]